MKKINLLDMVKIVSLAVLSMAFLIPTLVPVQAEAWHISGFELKGCAPSWLGGDCDGSPAPAAAATTPAITGSCSANISALTTGGSVVWTVYPAGGNGTYTYSWSGTDSLSGTSNSVTKVYGLSGSKTASVNVVSGGTTKAITCSTIVSVSDSNNNNNNSALSAACYPNTSSTNIGNTVTWVANASGATGNYSYYWSGTDALVGSGSSVSKVYGSTGSKSATVTVTSGSYSQTISCSSNVQVSDYNYNNNNNYYSSLSATCSPNTTSTNVNNSVIWTAYATGGNGSYYYSWNGTDGLYGSGAYASRSYSYAGNKTAYVTITSGGQSITTYCGNSVNVYDNNYSNNYTYSGTNWNSVPYYGYNGTYGSTGYDNSYNYNYNYNNYPTLNVTCSANIASGVSGNTVAWTAAVSGGNGAYTYAWTGTDSLVGYTQSVNKTYWYAGPKTATVTVVSNGQSVTRTCGNSVAISTIPITITDTTTTVAKPAVATATTRTPELVVACAPNTAQVNLNDTAVWISNITGGNGKYTYDWQGSDGLAGDTNFLTKTYVTNGQKTAVLTVKSGTQTVTRICGNVAVGENSNNLSASAFFAGWTGPFIILLLIAIIVFLGIILYFINLRDRNHPVVTTATQNYDNNNLL